MYKLKSFKTLSLSTEKKEHLQSHRMEGEVKCIPQRSMFSSTPSPQSSSPSQSHCFAMHLFFEQANWFHRQEESINKIVYESQITVLRKNYIHNLRLISNWMLLEIVYLFFKFSRLWSRPLDYTYITYVLKTAMTKHAIHTSVFLKVAFTWRLNKAKVLNKIKVFCTFDV